MNSLTRRLLATSLLVLLLFGLLTGLALELASVRNAELAEQDRLRGLVYGLLGAADPEPDGGLSVAEPLLPAAELRQPGSGVEAVLWDADGQAVWRSPSVLGERPPPPNPPAVGDFRFARVRSTEGVEIFRLLFGLSWLHEDGVERRYLLSVRQDVAPFEARRQGFRRTLWLWLGLFTLVLLAIQALVLRWGLRPLRALDGELAAIRRGQAERVVGRYPVELQPLGDGFNALLAHERAQQGRYRDALRDLEERARERVQDVYHHHGIERREEALALVDDRRQPHLARSAAGQAADRADPERAVQGLPRQVDRLPDRDGCRIHAAAGAGRPDGVVRQPAG